MCAGISSTGPPPSQKISSFVTNTCLTGVSKVINDGVDFEILGEIHEVVESLESIVGGKSAANEEVRKASKLIKQVEGVIAPYNGKEVDKIVFFALQDVRDTILLLANLIKGTQKSYFVTKMVFASTIAKKLVAASDDLLEALDSLTTASNIHSNEMLKKRVAEEQAAQEKHMRRQQAILDRKFAVLDGEIPPDQYSYKTDKPFARGGTAAAFIVEFEGEEHCAKVWDVSQVTMVEREKITKTFKRELAINSKLHCKHIVHVWGCTTSDPKKLVMLMELIENGDLRVMLDNKELNKTLTIKMKIRILRDIAEAMKYLYEQNPPIEHRDLKTPNVLLTADMRAKVSDFGLSKSDVTMNTATVMSLATSGGFKGTPQWSAPEILQGGISAFTEKADVYSFGVIMFEVLTGKRPWTGQGHPQIIDKVCYKKERPSPLPKVSNQALIALMQSAWAHDKKDRPTFAGVCEAFENMDEERKAKIEKLRKAERERKAKEAALAKRKEEEEKRKAEEIRRKKAEKEKKAEIEKLRKAERERKAKEAALAKRKRKEEEEKRKAEEIRRKKAERERKAKEAALAKVKEEEERKAEEVRRKKVEEEKRLKEKSTNRESPKKRWSCFGKKTNGFKFTSNDQLKEAAKKTNGFKFTSNYQLKDAAKEWVQDKDKAKGKYGKIEDWDVSEVTMLGLQL
ncbi:hypothetical protein TrCOL_g9849 [Triparma columacea]|uniref:Protein kinase domain-containing protein n=1 Tax=Triparma columacea TaxID=722753 RepID=A0A9W7L6I4_9STRA|nr:hypothetical protein TrCOL_g9849 [Triparma columacea]